MNSSRPHIKTLLGVALLALTGLAQASVQLNLTNTDLTPDNPAPPSTSGVINGATYTRTDTQPTGTGYIDPFVRVGMQGSAGKEVVHAYNTTVDGILNNSNEDNWNHEVKFGQIQIQTVGSLSFVRFLLDINQNSGGTGEFLNLDDVQIFISSVPNQYSTTFTGDGQIVLTGSNLVYRMDALPDSTASSQPDPCQGKNGDCAVYDQSSRVTLDYSINSGSGSGDMYLDIPVSMFDAAFTAAGLTTDAQKNGAYVYLYSKFGSDPYSNNDGFEEWSFLSKVDNGGGGGGGAPEPSTMLLAGLAILAARSASRRRKA